MTSAILIPCPACSGTGTDTHEDRHAETRQDVCPTCAPYEDVHPGRVPAQTGETRAASFDPAAEEADVA